MTRLVAKINGESQWFRVEPRAEDVGLGVDEEDAEARQERYEGQFSALWLNRDTPCTVLAGLQPASRAPVYILVHGIYGDGVEWRPVLPVLRAGNPAAVFMFRWSPAGQHRELARSITAGVLRIAECYPNAAPLVMLAHSAGGVIAAFSAQGFTLPSPDKEPRLWVLTVASPLAGTGYRRAAEEEEEEDESDSGERLMYELGGSHQGYPAAAPGVSVIHFRTQYPADRVMKPNLFKHVPNERGVGVAGAREVDLPAELGHEASLLYLARELVAGRVLSPGASR
ncbi:MAG: esterase/lipase family protein [Myxococcaceae bacterium]